MASILVVDDEKNIVTTLESCLVQEGYTVSVAANGEEALGILKGNEMDLMVLDIVMPGMDGMDVLERLPEVSPRTKVIMISAMGSIEDAVRATKLGAYDFIEKPLSLEKLLLSIRHALEVGELERENIALRKRVHQQFEMIGESEPIQRIRWEVEQAASSNARVLIRGENGTGKELVARALHASSRRAHARFVEVNCAAIPSELIESELFGHMRGAFTGADEDRTGRFEEAHGGTLFLDEVGDMSLKTQAKVLRCLQENRIQRVGSSRYIDVDARVIAATNQDLESKMESGEFREDLFYRLNVIPIQVPPLKERRRDISLLAEHFLVLFCEENGRKPKALSPAAVETLQRYDWPGNVRELKNICERLVIMFPGETISDTDVDRALGVSQEPLLSPTTTEGDLRTAVARFEKAYIEEVLRRTGGNVSEAARELGVERSQVYKKLKRLKALLLPDDTERN